MDKDEEYEPDFEFCQNYYGTAKYKDKSFAKTDFFKFDNDGIYCEAIDESGNNFIIRYIKVGNDDEGMSVYEENPTSVLKLKKYQWENDEEI